MSIMKDFSWKTSKLATKDWLFLLKDLKTKDIIFVQLSIDFCSSSTPSTYRKVQQERPNFLDIMKDFSSLRKTLEFLLFLQNERQLRKTSWIGLLSLLLDDNFVRHYNQEREKFWMHAFLCIIRKTLRGGEIVQERLMQNIFLAEKCWWKTPHYFYERLFFVWWQMTFFSEDVFCLKDLSQQSVATLTKLID